MVSQNVRPQC